MKKITCENERLSDWEITRGTWRDEYDESARDFDDMLERLDGVNLNHYLRDEKRLEEYKEGYNKLPLFLVWKLFDRQKAVYLRMLDPYFFNEDYGMNDEFLHFRYGLAVDDETFAMNKNVPKKYLGQNNMLNEIKCSFLKWLQSSRSGAAAWAKEEKARAAEKLLSLLEMFPETDSARRWLLREEFRLTLVSIAGEANVLEKYRTSVWELPSFRTWLDKTVPEAEARAILERSEKLKAEEAKAAKKRINKQEKSATSSKAGTLAPASDATPEIEDGGAQNK